MTQLTNNIYAVQVPDDFEATQITEWTLYYKSSGRSYLIGLPPKGSWQYLFTTKGCSEEDARKVVKELPVGQRYENYSGDYPVWYHTARESLQSLLRSKGLDDKKNYAILKLNDNG